MLLLLARVSILTKDLSRALEACEDLEKVMHTDERGQFEHDYLVANAYMYMGKLEAAMNFSNQALEVSTDLSPEEVLDTIQEIERTLGRNRAAEAIEKASKGVRYTSRPIDIDIAFYDDEVIETEQLTIPHPLLAEREFALAPLSEIVRSKRHPVTGLTVGEMYDALRANGNETAE